jgi:hypothetical protein
MIRTFIFERKNRWRMPPNPGLALALLSLSGCGARAVVDQPLANVPSCSSVTLGLDESKAYFPYRAGNHWRYAGVEPLASDAPSWVRPRTYQSKLAISDGGASAVALTETTIDHGSATPSTVNATRHVRLDDSGVVNLDGAPRVGTPYHEVELPLRACASFVAYDVPPGNHDTDLDGDGQPDAQASRAVVTVRGFEPVDTQAGAFADAVRIERNLSESVTLSRSGRSVTFTKLTNVVEWYAKGVGLVRRTFHDPDWGNEDESLIGASIDGGGKGALPEGVLVDAVAQADSDETNPGRAEVAFDGQRFLVVSAQTIGGSRDGRLVGTLVSRAGAVEKTVVLAPLIAVRDQPIHIGVAFDGQSYLVTYSVSADLIGVRVSPAGDVLGMTTLATGVGGVAGESAVGVAAGHSGFLVAYLRPTNGIETTEIAAIAVSPDGTTSPPLVVAARAGRRIAVAFDGVRFLVIWEEAVQASDFTLAGDTNIYAARVTPSGTSLDPTGVPIATGPAMLGDPDVMFDGTNYVATWFKKGNPTFVGDGFILAARISVDGTVLDSSPIVVAASSEAKGAPRVVRFAGTDLIVWAEPGNGIRGRRLDGAGRLLDGVDGDDGWWLSEPIRAAALPSIVVAPDRALLLWLETIEENSQSKSLHATLLLP